MSDSRLEKFIYAICSMDVSDLPVPLSRIEKLWNCLITGETPDFEPLSRNEKYLMAMLDRYDISNLPAPMSRGEKLLYKIAVGETDLSDVPGYLSRYEELLKYLIENGEIGGGDFEYVLYTLNQSLYTLYTTAEKPVKSAILTGNTINCLLSVNNTPNASVYDYSRQLEVGETYTIFYNYVVTGDDMNIVVGEARVGTSGTAIPNTAVINGRTNAGTYIGKKVVTLSNVSSKMLINWIRSGTGTLTVNELYCIQGDYSNVDVPFVSTGLQSVKMPVLTTVGKNLFDGKLEYGIISGTNGLPYNSNDYVRTQNFIPINCETITFTVINEECGLSFYYYDKDKNFISNKTMTKVSDDLSIPENVAYLKFRSYPISDESITNNLNTQIQIEEGSVATEYEPYKSNILTVNEDVTLRGIGDVQDKLDCLTGEVTESIREIVLDGTQYMDADGRGIYIQVDDMKKVEDYRTIITCDKLPVFYHQWDLPNVENGIAGYLDDENKYPGQNWLYIKVNNSIDVNEVRQILTQNPITFQYQRVADSIKTVDLTVVDQDNQPTQLGTFENVTHVSLVAENLIPEVEMEVATNLLEDTVFNLTNAFNTLYPTAAKPVKSAILKGNTLINMAKQQEKEFIFNDRYQMYTVINNVQPGGLIHGERIYMSMEVNIHEINIETSVFKCVSFRDAGGYEVLVKSFDEIKNMPKNTWVKISTIRQVDKDLSLDNYSLQFGIHGEHPTVNGEQVARVSLRNPIWINLTKIYGNGNEPTLTECDNIPYFEGMQSVKMPVLTTIGKNLFDKTRATRGYIINANGVLSVSGGNGVTDYIKVESGKTYVRNVSGFIAFYDSNKNFIERTSTSSTKFTAVNDGYIRWNVGSYDEVIDTLQVEEGSTSTSYEPYKSNILTTPEDLELRGFGNVKDELNLMTGEISNNFNKITIDGTEDWQKTSNETELTVRYRCNNIGVSILKENMCICDSYNVGGNTTGDNLAVAFGGTTLTYRVLKSKFPTLEVFKKWLNDNPHTFIYQTEKSIKTVDLTVVDQDNQPTELGTFDNTTHVLLNSEGLIPTAVLTVRTKIPSASSTSLLMDDISTNQQQLETTVDEQSNNVDATMVATTEIFEDTL